MLFRSEGDDIAPAVMLDQFELPVRWTSTVRSLEPAVVLDLGPTDGVARLTAANLRGSGKRVLALDVQEGRRQLLDAAGPGPQPEDWRRFKPTLERLDDGTVLVRNKFTQAAGQPPVLLPGMTPTTVDAPIVAAAANAGFWSEQIGRAHV